MSAYQQQVYDDVATMIELDDASHAAAKSKLIHWSKGTPRQKAIIEARLALGSDPDGVLCWYSCGYCDEGGLDGWSLIECTEVNDKCPQCDNWTIPTGVYDMWDVEES